MRSAVPRFGSRSRKASQATNSAGSAATSIAMRQLKRADSAPPRAMPMPPPAMPITCWMENAFPRCSGG